MYELVRVVMHEVVCPGKHLPSTFRTAAGDNMSLYELVCEGTSEFGASRNVFGQVLCSKQRGCESVRVGT